MTSEALLVVTNRRAGGTNQLDRALAALRQGAPDLVAVDTEDAHLDDALRAAAGRTVVAAGGDGTLHLLVQSLWSLGALRDTVLGLLPLGTGNDWPVPSASPWTPWRRRPPCCRADPGPSTSWSTTQVAWPSTPCSAVSEGWP